MACVLAGAGPAHSVGNREEIAAAFEEIFVRRCAEDAGVFVALSFLPDVGNQVYAQKCVFPIALEVPAFGWATVYIVGLAHAAIRME